MLAEDVRLGHAAGVVRAAGHTCPFAAGAKVIAILDDVIAAGCYYDVGEHD